MGPYINKKIKGEKERAGQQGGLPNAPRFWTESWQALRAVSGPVTIPLKTVAGKPLPHLARVGFAVRPVHKLHSHFQKLVKYCILKRSVWGIIPSFLPVSVLSDLPFFLPNPCNRYYNGCNNGYKGVILIMFSSSLSPKPSACLTNQSTNCTQMAAQWFVNITFRFSSSVLASEPEGLGSSCHSGADFSWFLGLLKL